MRPASAARLAGCLALLLLAASGAVEAASKLEPPDLKRYLRWGPLRVRPGLEVSNLGYDDNILLDSSGNEVGDYTLTFAPKLEGLMLLGGRGFVELDAAVGRTFYLDNHDQEFTNYRGSTRVTVPDRSRRFGLFVDFGLTNSKQRAVDLDTVRPEREERKVATGLILLPGWRTEVELGQSFNDVAYSTFSGQNGVAQSDSFDTLSRFENELSLRIRYRVLGRTRVLFSGTLTDFDFDNPTVTPSGDVFRDARDWRLLTGLEFGEGGALSGSVKFGWGRIDADDPSLTDFADPLGEIDLVYRLSSRTRVRLEGERYPGFSVASGSAYYLNRNVGVRLLHYVNNVLGLEGSGSFGDLTFPEGGAADREDRIQRYDAGIRLRMFANSMGRRTEMTLKVGRYRRDSTVPSLDRSRTTVTAGAVVGF